MGKEQDPRQFEKGGEVREEQTRNVREEAREIPEKARRWDLRTREDQEQ